MGVAAQNVLLRSLFPAGLQYSLQYNLWYNSGYSFALTRKQKTKLWSCNALLFSFFRWTYSYNCSDYNYKMLKYPFKGAYMCVSYNGLGSAHLKMLQWQTHKWQKCCQVSLTQCQESGPRWRPGCLCSVLSPICTRREHQWSNRLQSAPPWNHQNLPEGDKALTTPNNNKCSQTGLNTAVRCHQGAASLWENRSIPWPEAELESFFAPWRQLVRHDSANDIKSSWGVCALPSEWKLRSEKMENMFRRRAINLYSHKPL